MTSHREQRVSERETAKQKTKATWILLNLGKKGSSWKHSSITLEGSVELYLSAVVPMLRERKWKRGRGWKCGRSVYWIMICHPKFLKALPLHRIANSNIFHLNWPATTGKVNNRGIRKLEWGHSRSIRNCTSQPHSPPSSWRTRQLQQQDQLTPKS